MSAPSRGQWSSQLGFVLAAAGSAVGLGNIWRFPYSAGENGGAAFVLVYLLCVLMLGFPVMLLEISIGRRTEKNPVGAIRSIHSGGAWTSVGYLALITGVGILSFYAVIAGQVLAEMVDAARGLIFGHGAFAPFGPIASIIYFAVFLVLTELLEAAGVDTIKELRNRNAPNLAEKMTQVNSEKKLARATPSVKQVEDWVGAAKKMEPVIKY